MFAYLPTLLLAATAVVADYNPIFSREALSAMTAHDAGQNCAAHQSLVCCDKTEKCSTLDMGSKWHPYIIGTTDAELTLFYFRGQEPIAAQREMYCQGCLLQVWRQHQGL
jgi:hypothetical protein